KSLSPGDKSMSRFGVKSPENLPQGSVRIKNRRINQLIIRDMIRFGGKEEGGFPLPVETPCMASLPPIPTPIPFTGLPVHAGGAGRRAKREPLSGATREGLKRKARPN
ncbi:MAG: hypothetical protein LBJ60_01320, partial [Tannerellaceae bacterium]|nr:hypothetical protein [Tannerellaceae bacterium]